MEPLSPRNPRIQAVRRLARKARDRADRRAFVVEGPTLVAEAVAAAVDLDEVYCTVDFAEAAPDWLTGSDLDVVVVADEAIAAMSTTVTPQPVVAVATMAQTSVDHLVARTGHLLVLDAVQDPGNAGTILRSAEASGAAGVIFGPGSVDRFSPKVVRSSAGSLFRLPTTSVTDLREVFESHSRAGRPALAAVMSGGQAYDQTELRSALLVMGNEANGVSDLAEQLVDDVVHIPQAGANESLNVAMAATILCFEAARQRRAQ
jgi:TrmH family RNA methyltransferase